MGLIKRAQRKIKRTIKNHQREVRRKQLAEEKKQKRLAEKAEKKALREARKAEIAELNEYFRSKAEAQGKHKVFTVIIASYNAGEYLSRTVKTVARQTIGRENTQVIIVDDGSTDNTKEVVDTLSEKYPGLVEYYYKENGGVSSARNLGMQHMDGLFVSFLDSDDKLSLDTFYEVLKFSKEHPEIRVFAMRTTFFAGRHGSHPLDYICLEDAVIDLRTDYDHYPLSATRSLIHYSALEGKSFRTDLHYTEDSYIVHEIMLDGEPIFGALQRPRYFYRKRPSGDSASDASKTRPEWYTETLEKSHIAILDRATDENGNVPKYIQYAVMYDIYWRIRASVNREELDQAFIDAYIATIEGILSRIDDDVILAVRNVDIALRVYTFAKKHGYDVDKLIASIRNTHDGLIIDTTPGGAEASIPIKNTENWTRATLDVVALSEDKKTLLIDGNLTLMRTDPAQMSLQFSDGENWFEAKLFPHPHNPLGVPLWQERLGTQVSFKVELPINSHMSIAARASIGKGPWVSSNFSYGKFAHLNGTYKDSSFSFLDDRHVIYLEGDPETFSLSICDNHKSEFKKREKALEEQMKLSLHGKEMLELRRAALRQRKENPQERIWVFTDRVTSAEDSGEVMFRYVLEHPIEHVRPVFIIRDDVPDYGRLQAVGEVIAADSPEHLIAIINADKIISSAGDEWVINPFGRDYSYFKDLLHFDFVFLQHGVIKESLADWLYKNSKNISLFVTSAPRERQSIVDGDYGYEPEQIILTGLPRWDNFANSHEESKRVIYFMPTWRNYLSTGAKWNSDDLEDTAALVEWFSDTDYFKVINSVLEDPRLLALLEQYDYTLKFAPHPRVGAAFSLFSASEHVELLKPESFTYADAFKEMSMLITDYSSTAFNVAIMRKAIAYIQFDKEEFYDKHTGTKDYYDYEEDGFGPVVTTKDELVDVIEQRLASNMAMDEKYSKRVDDFFFVPEAGRSHASLVMDEIQKLDAAHGTPWKYVAEQAVEGQQL